MPAHSSRLSAWFLYIVSPTVMTWFIARVIGIVMLIAGGLSVGIKILAWYDRTFGVSLACFVLVALVAQVFDRLRLRVDRDGISLGVRPLPVDGYPFSGMKLLRSFEVHALTTQGEAVCLKRLKESRVTLRPRSGDGWDHLPRRTRRFATAGAAAATW
jgi:hypothetical protein